MRVGGAPVLFSGREFLWQRDLLKKNNRQNNLVSMKRFAGSRKVEADQGKGNPP